MEGVVSEIRLCPFVRGECMGSRCLFFNKRTKECQLVCAAYATEEIAKNSENLVDIADNTDRTYPGVVR
jgi:hypothetical protein